VLLRNLCDRDGLVNGTRLRLIRIQPHILEVVITSGSHVRKIAFIPRITLLTNNTKDSHYNLRRLQFPVRLSFAMTINKSQGQTINRVALVLLTPVFTHGQLYVAASRTRSHENLKIFLPQSLDNRNNRMFNNIFINSHDLQFLSLYLGSTRNVVYKEVFSFGRH
jgi:ATP-dependent DNA helicase PIF1